MPRPTSCEEAPGGGVCSSMETMPLDGKMVHYGGDVCVMCIRWQKVFRAGFFCSRQSAVKLSRCSIYKLSHMCATSGKGVNSLPAIDAHERQLFDKLLWGLVTSMIFVRC
jgi:hypothetical protein